MKDRKIHKRLTAWSRDEIPKEHLDFAMRRVDYLEGVAFDHSLRYLLACAYLQGINDCAAMHVNRPELARLAIKIAAERASR